MFDWQYRILQNNAEPYTHGYRVMHCIAQIHIAFRGALSEQCAFYIHIIASCQTGAHTWGMGERSHNHHIIVSAGK